jgi:hypothetical protein
MATDTILRGVGAWVSEFWETLRGERRNILLTSGYSN